jgi:predicted nucleic acid-binding protein
VAEAAVAYAYFDTSALVKRYVDEPGSLEIRRLLRARRVMSSALLRVEVLSALRRRRDEAVLSTRAFARLLRRVEADDASWQLVPVSDEIVAAARIRVLQQSVRTLDAIHLASAEALHREGLRIPFVTADARQADAGRAIGLDVVPVGVG